MRRNESLWSSVVVAIVVMMLVAGPALGRGGFRKDMSGGWFTNIAKESIEIALKVGLMRLKIRSAPKWTLNPLGDTRGTLRDDIIEAQEELKLFLASTPRGQEPFDAEINDLNRSNKEINEVENAVVNMLAVTEEYRKDLVQDSSDLEAAKSYYTVQRECLIALASMSTEFTDNIDNKYLPQLGNLVSRLEALRARGEDELHRLTAEDDLEVTRRLIVQQEQAIVEARRAMKVIEEQRAWAERRTSVFEDKIRVTTLALDTATAINDALLLIRQVQTSLDSLKGSPLPLVVFETDVSRFQIS